MTSEHARDVVLDAFREADPIGDGLFDRSTIARLLGLLDDHWTEHRVDELLNGMELDPHRQISGGDFVAWLFGHRNVYCDGVYDLCHMGHKTAFKNAASLGTRLIVGVVGDEDANNYKRPPIMSASERELEVSRCQSVAKVIHNAPCFGLTEDFIKEHDIHVVACGQEYWDRFPNPDDDPYYGVPRKMGICKPIPRYDGISTSEIIQRILSRGTVEKKSPT